MNHYETLGVTEDATDQQIKEGYRREAMEWHPDRHEGEHAKRTAEAQFKRITEAYRILRDANTRAEYDRTLRQEREFDSNAQDSRAGGGSTQHSSESYGRAEPHAGHHQHANADEASDAEANAIFFEQMLDLAFELAGRGFGESGIAKALVGLGCPEAMARAVASTAARHGHSSAGSDIPRAPAAPSIGDIASATWEDAKPYYAAVVAGRAGADQLSDADFAKINAKLTRRSHIALGVFGTLLALILATGMYTTADASVPRSWINVAFVVLLLLVPATLLGWLVSRSAFLGPGASAYRKEGPRRYYMNAFKELHLATRPHKPATLVSLLIRMNWAALFFNVLWAGYRRQLGLATGLAFVYGCVAFAASMFITDVASGDAAWYLSGLAVSLTFSSVATRLYFKRAQAKIRKALTGSTPANAIEKLRRGGGTNSLGWLLPMAIAAVFYVPGMMVMGERTRAGQLIAQQAAAQRGAAEAQRTKAEQAILEANAAFAFDKAVTELEARHPELNPNSPRYSQELVNEALALFNTYTAAGTPRDQAVRRAVADLEAKYARQAASHRATPERSKFDRAVAEIEARYPELNVDSPRFDQALTDKVLQRHRIYLGQGIAPDQAIRRAVRDIEASANGQVRSQHGSSDRTTSRPVVIPGLNISASGEKPPKTGLTRDACVYKGVMSDDDYRPCGIKPPSPE